MKRHKMNSVVAGTSQKTKSWVASRFIVIEQAGVFKRRCKFQECTKEYSRGTSHMILKRHWSKAHEDHFSDPQASTRANSNEKNSLGQTNYKEKKKPLNANNFTQSNTGNKNKIGSQSFGPGSLNNKPSNNEKVQLDVKLVAKRLKEATSIHLTFDIYTAKKGAKSYGIITAHSLSDSLEIKTVLLEYKHLPYPDDTNTIYEFLRSCVTRFNIREKIVSLASNCTTTIATAVQELDKRYRLSKNFNFSTIHIRCFPQFVHLNVLEVLRSQEALIESVRKVVGFINSHNFTLRPLQDDPNASSGADVGGNNDPKYSNTSGEAEAGIKSTGLKLPFDNRSSWNTTYNMIEIFLQQRGYIEPTLVYYQNPQDLAGINIDWDRLFTLIALLKPFHDVVNKFSTDNYTPVSLVAVSIPHLMDHLSSSSWVYDDLVMAAHNFKLQLESYRQFFQSDLTVISGLLDPRVKDTFISQEGKDDAIDILRKRLESSLQNKNETQTHQYSADTLWARVFRSFDYDEITDYLRSPREHGYTSNVAYWEAHKNVYPCLYNLARTLVCVQATSVPNDRMFSAAENAEREKKLQIESTNSKELMKSWAKYLEK